MSMPSLGAFRNLFGLLSSPAGANGPAGTDKPLGEGKDQRPAMDEAARPKQETGNLGDPKGGAGTQGGESPVQARLLSAYLSARADETLGLLIEALGREMTRELRQAEAETGQTISADIAEVREDVASSQRELSRIGRELVRSGATLESMQAGVSTIAITLERLNAALQENLARGRAGAEVDLAGRDEILATLDGLEIGLQEGRELGGALAGVQNRLKDATVQRWWRAMGEATGVKRPLPEVPLADLESLVTGLELTYRRLQDALARNGVTVIEAVGKPFDPYVPEAVGVEPCPEEQDGLVLREQRRGYRTTDRVIRLSQVVVGRGEPNRARRGRPRAGRVEQIAETDGRHSEKGPEGAELQGTDR